MMAWLKYPKIFPLVVLFLSLIAVPTRAEEQIKAQPAIKPALSTGRYVTGGVIGSVFGLGIGHAIQGRYIPLGLVFTLGEAAGYAAFFADTKFGTTNTGLVTSVRATSIGTIGAIGLVVVTGLHIWEVIDLWVTGASLRDKAITDAGPRLMIVPTVMHNEAPALTMAFRF